MEIKVGGFPALLTILFIGLKLSNVIAWSWVWVLSPIWIPFAVVGAILALFGILLVLGELCGVGH